MYADALLAAPIAERKPTTRIHHGDVFVDPYEWREKDNPEVISYLEAENAYTEAQTAHLSELSDAVFSEIKRTKETDLSVPSYTSHPGGSAYWYYVRTVEGSEYPIYCRVVAMIARTTRSRTGDRRRRGSAGCQPRGRRQRILSLGAFSLSSTGDCSRTRSI